MQKNKSTEFAKNSLVIPTSQVKGKLVEILLEPNTKLNDSLTYDITSWSLEPGDLIAFNFATVHGAPGNSSKNRRRAFSARFTGDDARFIKRKGEISPPFPEVLLNSGDKMDCDTFPKIDF